jgi:predicted RNA methylase
MAEIGPGDVLYDLGSGTGRIIVTAAKKYGIKAVGIERDRFLAWLSKRVIRRNKLEDRVRILRADFFQQNLSEATVITVYLSQKMNNRLEPKLRKELKRGTRIVSADHTFNFTEKGKARTGYFWTHLYTR